MTITYSVIAVLINRINFYGFCHLTN